MGFKRFCLVVLVLLVVCPTVWAGPMVHGWSQRFGDAANSQFAYSVAVDASGNVFVTGRFYGTVDFGGGALTSAGNEDLYIAKFDAAGNHLWSQRFGDASLEWPECVAVDGWGNVVVTGYFEGTVDFGGGVLTSAGSKDIFIAKFDAAGTHLWSQSFGDGSDNQYGYYVAVDASGNVFLTGNFYGTVDFGGGVLTSAGTDDIYVVKFDAAGNHLWSQSFGDGQGQYAYGGAVDGLGNVFVTRRFYGTVNFGGGVLTSAGSSDIYVVKFDAAGTHMWSQSFGASGFQNARRVAVDNSGNVFVTGYFQNTVNFGGGVLTSAGGEDIYIAKFDAAGNHQWSRRFGDSSNQYLQGVAVDGWGNVFVTGYFQGNVNFGGDNLTSVGYYDIYAAKFDSAGNHLWSRRFGDSCCFDWSVGLAVDDWGNLFLTGYFEGSINFGGGNLTTAGLYDIYVAKFWRAAPEIHAIRDIPGDQGGSVNVAWDASGVDTPAEHVVTHYTVWRAISPELASEMIDRGASVIEKPTATPSKAGDTILRLAQLGGVTYYWKLITSVDAYYLPGYSEPVATLFDSTAVSTEYHYFQVIAHTSDPYVFWASEPDSGYSVDNLAPGVPKALAGKQSIAPDGLNLTWTPNTEADLSNYAVYRGTSEDFIPGPGNLMASPEDTTSFDGGWSWSSGYYYKVSAIDIHGNESPFALLTPEDISGSGGSPMPVANYLEHNYPNPFCPSTKIAFGIKETTDVSLKIYDTAGRLVRVLVDGKRDARRYEIRWDGLDDKGRALASGIYFFQLTVNDQKLTRKAVLLK